MTEGEFAFFLGAAPGLIYTIMNMIRLQQVINAAEAMARAHGEVLDFNLSTEMSASFLFHPGRFLKHGDGPGVMAAKTHLLAARRTFLRRHLLGFVYASMGAFVSSFTTSVFMG